MNPKESSEVTVETLLALRQESDALRCITEKLRVKDMGPAGHIRTKHEGKAFMESGNLRTGELLLRNAAERRSAHERIVQSVSQKPTQRLR